MSERYELGSEECLGRRAARQVRPCEAKSTALKNQLTLLKMSVTEIQYQVSVGPIGQCEVPPDRSVMLKCLDQTVVDEQRIDALCDSAKRLAV
jgi:hypothetical protein